MRLQLADYLDDPGRSRSRAPERETELEIER